MEIEIQPELSVVILCYKAGNYVKTFVSRMKQTLEEKGINSYELVLVANYNKNEASSDITPAVAKDIAKDDPTLKVVSMIKAGMMGWDMHSGFEAATGKNIAIIDGDGQMPPEDIVKIYKVLKSGDYDMAKTYREERYDGIWRICISRVYNFLLKALFPKVKVRDANSKPKIFTNRALRKLRLTSDDWFADAEIIIQASYLGFSIKEVPTIFHVNEQRPSFIKFRAIFEFFKNLISYRIKNLHGFK